MIDIDARISELGRQPYTARAVLHQVPGSNHVRTDTRPNRDRSATTIASWKPTTSTRLRGEPSPPRILMIYGVFLPKEVLAKVYHKERGARAVRREVRLRKTRD